MRGGEREIGCFMARLMARLMALEFRTKAWSVAFWSEFLGRLWSYLGGYLGFCKGVHSLGYNAITRIFQRLRDAALYHTLRNLTSGASEIASEVHTTPKADVSKDPVPASPAPSLPSRRMAFFHARYRLRLRLRLSNPMFDPMA
jgi:hypothetical protein